jgi:hypothetical protein
MGSWHTVVSPYHYENPFCCGLLVLKKKKKIISHVFIKWVVTLIQQRAHEGNERIMQFNTYTHLSFHSLTAQHMCCQDEFAFTKKSIKCTIIPL